jgi:pimeloyl-ACP methyl ester carboxylesterase
MKLSLIDFETEDRLRLPGLLYEPDEQTDAVLIGLHGNGGASVLYSGEEHEQMAAALGPKGIAYFAFNNRGAHEVHHLKRRNDDETYERVPAGMAYELIADCALDIDGAVRGLRERGYRRFYLMGESTGANKICVYDHLRPDNEIAKYVLVSPADDSGVYYEELGRELFEKVLEHGRQRIQRGDGLDEVPREVRAVMGYMSWRSAVDMLDPDGDYNTFPYLDAMRGLGLSTKPLFGYFAGMAKPYQVVLGELDEYAFGDAPRALKLLREHANPAAEAEFVLLTGADHGLHGHFGELAERVATFLAA